MSAVHDPRRITAGREIPTERYADQPYVVRTDDGAWLCVVTTGAGREGEPGQHIVSMRSTDQGRTWSRSVDVEPADGPEASYAVLLKAPPGCPAAGRVYCFYNHNSDNLRAVRADDPPFAGGLCRRVDSLGHFVFRYSDDHGQSWSAERYRVPLREMEIDRANAYGGAVRFFWNVGKPFVHRGAAYVSVHKVGGFGEGFFTRSEGVLAASENLLWERDPERATWTTLPDGDYGLRTPPGGGPIAEEQSYVVLSDGSFYAVYRTIDGHPACAYSRDQGHTWTEPRYVCYPDGRPIKHPRAANFCWRCANGKYLYWFHNHGGRQIREHPQRASIAYRDRNPVWLCGGVEVQEPGGNELLWSQPEIVLYDDDPAVRISYPDLIEEDGRIYLTETQKEVARVHEVARDLVEGLWGQLAGAAGVPRDGLLLEARPGEGGVSHDAPLPALPPFAEQGGVTVEVWFRPRALDDGQVTVGNRGRDGRGFALQTDAGGVQLTLCDGQTENRWSSDPALLQEGRLHHVVAIADAVPRVTLIVVDGKLCDGGEARQFGWGRFSPHLRDVNGGPGLRIGPTLDGDVLLARVYGRSLRVSEAIASYRVGPG
ncbi:MAG: exo-alpha-sialidase [Anaerolineae bacterium]|nr:exo-alpha-sialidase [Anaerolineae bacterium]